MLLCGLWWQYYQDGWRAATDRPTYLVAAVVVNSFAGFEPEHQELLEESTYSTWLRDFLEGALISKVSHRSLKESSTYRENSGLSSGQYELKWSEYFHFYYCHFFFLFSL